jgi:L-lysine 6-transaminase
VSPSAFGKKTQVCGLMAGGRVDEVPDNVFATSSRINSTWGGSLTDMVASRRILEVVESERLIERAAELGPACLACSPSCRHARRGHGRTRPWPDVRVLAARPRHCATGCCPPARG